MTPQDVLALLVRWRELGRSWEQSIALLQQVIWELPSTPKGTLIRELRYLIQRTPITTVPIWDRMAELGYDEIVQLLSPT